MKVLVTGGAGFIGSNTVRQFLKDGHEVLVLDNCSRPGAAKNLEWLRQIRSFEFYKADIRDYRVIRQVISPGSNLDLIVHLAGQVAVTTSVQYPRDDFEQNLLGTINILEAMRETYSDATLIFASTNKVYGGLHHLPLVKHPYRYVYETVDGIDEQYPLDFHSPYGCSKGAADQYVRDYGRIYDLRTVVFRQSCIYGPRQFGIEDQGWVAWFALAALHGLPLTVYGDGCQVRDVLHVDDLVKAFTMAMENIDKTEGKIFNIGGGPKNTLSVLELIAFLGDYLNKEIEFSEAEWRPGDQRVFVCDIDQATKTFGWKPEIDVETGLSRLCDWISNNMELFTHLTMRKA